MRINTEALSFLFNFQRRAGFHSSLKAAKDANLDIVKGCQLVGQVTVCEIGTSSAGARSRSFSDVVCRLTLIISEGRDSCREGGGNREAHDISPAQFRPRSSNSLT